MKTNQLMKVAFSEGSVEVFHGTAMGDLTQLWSVGQILRARDGRSAANLTRFLQSTRTIEFMEELNKNGITAVKINGKGNTRKTFASIEMMIYAAEYLSTSFHVEVIQTFVKSKILEYRDESGDQFKAMNIAIDNYLPERENKSSNKGIYINVAKMLRLKVNPDMQGWNFASADELQQRLRYENSITEWLSMGLVKNYDHLKELINKL